MPEYYGTEFILELYYNTYLDSEADKMAWSFKAPESKTVDKIIFYINVVMGTAPTYRIGIQTDSGGEPSGSWLGGDAYVDISSFSGNAWNTFDIPDNAVVAGTVYHIVAEWQSGTVDGSNHIRVRHYLDTWTKKRPVDNVDDTSYNTQLDTGAGWVAQDKDPCSIIIEYDDAAYALQPYHGEYADRPIYDNDYYGEEIVPNEALTITAIGFRISKVGTPAGALVLKVYDVDGSTEVLSETVTETITTSYVWVDHVLSAPLSLSSGNKYHVYLQSPSSVDTSNCFRVNPMQTGSAYQSISWRGITDRYARTATGTVPLNIFNSFRDLPFRLTKESAVTGGSGAKDDYRRILQALDVMD